MCDSITDCVDDVTIDPGEVKDAVTGGVSNVAESAATSAFDKFIQTMVDAANWVIERIMTLWLKAPDPDVSSAESPVKWLDAHLSYVVAATVIATMIWAGIRLAIYARSSDAVNLAETLVRTVLASVLTGSLVAVGLALADTWSEWILDKADLDLSLEVLAAGANPVAPGFLLILALFVLITQFVQLLFMIFRNAIVMVLTSTVTLAAAASGTRMGRQSYEKQVSWLIAFILYKPTAALIYALAFQAASSKELWSQLSGLGLMILSVATLPALQRLIAPVTANLGGANAGALAGAVVGAGVAMGAMAATGGASAAGGVGSSGAGGFLGGSGTTALPSGSGSGGSPSGATRADTLVPAPSGRPSAGRTGGPGGASQSGRNAPGDLSGEVTGGSPSGAESSAVDTSPSGTSTSSPSGADSVEAGPSGAPSTGAGDSSTSYSSAPAAGRSSTSGPGGAMGRTFSGGQRGVGGAHRLQTEADGIAGGESAGGPSGAGRADG